MFPIFPITLLKAWKAFSQFLTGQNREQPDKNSANQQFHSALFPESDRAIVLEPIGPNHLGRIYYQGTHWFACAVDDTAIAKDTIVRVIERRENTWLVQAVDTVAAA